MKTLIKNCSIISENTSEKIDENLIQDIYIVDGIIEDIGVNLQVSASEIIDLKGGIVMSGMIDLRCNICDPGFETVEDIESVSASALKGGFTSITCEPNTDPIIDNKTVVQYIVSKATTKSVVNIYPYGSMSIGCQGTELSEIGGMVQAGIIGISNGNTSIENAMFLRQVMLYSKLFNLPVVTHCEDKKLSGNGVMNAGYTATHLGLTGMLPEAEEIIVARNIILAEKTGAKLHITHVSTRGSVQLIREAKTRGIKVTADTNPQYFILTEEAVGDYNPLMKVNPPLRTKDDINGVLEGIIDGTIDAIASGHSPSAYRDKDLIFDHAVYGISALETLFPLCYTHLVQTNRISMKKLMELTSFVPSKILNLKNKGVIAKGKDADFIVIDLENSYEIDPKKFASKAKYSPFAGEKVTGKILHGMVGGKFFSDLSTR